MDHSPPKAPHRDGSRTIAEIVNDDPRGVPAVTMGKKYIEDIGVKLRQIAGLKPGSTSIRTPEMIDEIIDRLRDGESLTSVICDPRMPANSTLWNWREADVDLDARIRRAQAQGQHILRDATLNIAMNGELSSNDPRRDELMIKTIEKNIAQRNRQDFGEKVQVDHQRVVLNVPSWVSSVAVRTITDASFEPVTDDSEDDEGE